MTDRFHPQIFVNGRPVQSDRVCPLQFSESEIFVFESLKSYGGKIFRLNEHLDRLFESAKTIGLMLPKTRSELEKELTACSARYRERDVFLRLGVDKRNSYIVIVDRKRPSWIYEKGVPLKTSVTRRNFLKSEPTETKTSAFFNNVLAIMELKNSGMFESIFLDASGYVTEATIWNIFMVKGNTLFTPQVGILSGVTRQFVIKCAEKERISVSESNLTRHDFWNADEAFLTNTSGEIVPIRSLDGRTIGKEIPGEVTSRLIKRFKLELNPQLNP